MKVMNEDPLGIVIPRSLFSPPYLARCGCVLGSGQEDAS